MKKVLVLVTLLFFAVSSLCFADILKTKANLRKAPSQKSELVKLLEPGTEYNKVSEKGSWLEITTSTGDTGWIWAKNVKHVVKAPAEKAVKTTEQAVGKTTEQPKVKEEVKKDVTQPSTETEKKPAPTEEKKTE